MENNTNLKSLKSKLIEYIEKNKLGDTPKRLIENCNDERSLQMCMEILKENGEILPTQISYIILTD